MSVNSYIVHDMTEETSCDWCGCPLYIGDRAFPTASESAVFCCDSERRAWNNEERRFYAGLEGSSIYA